MVGIEEIPVRVGSRVCFYMVPIIIIKNSVRLNHQSFQFSPHSKMPVKCKEYDTTSIVNESVLMALSFEDIRFFFKK